jgi:iron complex outermembrane receptor protein
MSNTDSENSKLPSYFVNDLNASFEINPTKIAESIRINLLVNNIFNVKYISNGYYGTYDDDWSVPGEIVTLDYAGYYPQATTNFLIGATVRF